ncbi:Ras-related protein Rab-43 [Tritrichomonas foetus]|uniref:Ras-related protein Rab-43 n=1 Tax=Tritrichomonas foetus TaxID=1144522 RepID=A0A1J4K202_9EUKA|nr:Ras-related protein Rab-43 [Tritrichomonas foetus]|eukprot:OHT03509.1 Ras-related protein Rab-43 [Tritrichomonas foetus]
MKNQYIEIYSNIDMDDKENDNIKIIVVGDANVGKSCIVSQYVVGSFSHLSNPTVGAAFFSKEIEFQDKLYTLNIWDTAGQETYKYLVPMYYRNAGIAIYVFDITSEKSFLNITHWLSDVKKTIGDNVYSILCGNKMDLYEKRKVLFEVAQNLANEYNMLYTETCAKNGSGIDKLFELSLTEYLKMVERSEIEQQIHVDIDISKKATKENTCC